MGPPFVLDIASRQFQLGAIAGPESTTWTLGASARLHELIDSMRGASYHPGLWFGSVALVNVRSPRSIVAKSLAYPCAW